MILNGCYRRQQAWFITEIYMRCQCSLLFYIVLIYRHLYQLYTTSYHKYFFSLKMLGLHIITLMSLKSKPFVHIHFRDTRFCYSSVCIYVCMYTGPLKLTCQITNTVIFNTIKGQSSCSLTLQIIHSWKPTSLCTVNCSVIVSSFI